MGLIIAIDREVFLFQLAITIHNMYTLLSPRKRGGFFFLGICEIVKKSVTFRYL